MTASKAVANVFFFVVAGVLFILVSSSRLPHVLATWFPPWGPPGHWMARERFVAMQLIVLLVVPGLGVLGTLVIPRRAPGLLRPEFRSYWLDSSRREATLAALARDGVRFCGFVVALSTMLQFTVAFGNLREPPAELKVFSWLTIVGCFSLAIETVISAMRYRVPRGPDAR